MKYPCFAIAAFAALSIGTGTANANLINISVQLPNIIYGFNVGSSQPGAERNGMTWGIVVDTTGGSDFSMLNDSMSADSFSSGINKSGQWIGDDLIYLTSETPLPKTVQVGPPPLNMHGGITSTNGINGTGNGYNLAEDQTYSFVIIWFESSIAIDQTPSENSRYGFLNVEGFVIPKLDELNGRTVNLPAMPNGGNVANLVQTGYFTAAVPEPATYALLLGGLTLAGCVLARRRSGRKAVAAK